MEVMKGGAIRSTIDLRALSHQHGRGHVTFGRAPNNDVLLDHPSSSRVHAVVQFRTKDGTAFLYDPGSAHGTFLNKQRIPARHHVQLSVGDHIRFGESSRLHLLGGPSELLPEEGLNREQRRQAAALRALRARKEHDEQVAQAQMAVAIGQGERGGGVTWGMGGPSDDDLFDGVDEGMPLTTIDWRSHAATHGLTEKQQKIADKIRKRHLRMEHLQKECEAIRSKHLGGMEDLTPGQANTLTRNEHEIDKAMEEIEDLEETLMDSIRDSIEGRRHQQAAGATTRGNNDAPQQVLSRKRQKFRGDDGDDDSDSDDMFYDRTGEYREGNKTGGILGGKKPSGKRVSRGQQSAVAEDAPSLFGKLEALKEEKTKLERAIQTEKMSTYSSASAEGTSSLGAETIKTVGSGGARDSLDAYMTDVASALQGAKAAALVKELAAVEGRMKETQRLLELADPDGYYKRGTKAADLAVQHARRALELEKIRRQQAEVS